MIHIYTDASKDVRKVGTSSFKNHFNLIKDKAFSFTVEENALGLALPLISQIN
jgi:hypothetical protein